MDAKREWLLKRRIQRACETYRKTGLTKTPETTEDKDFIIVIKNRGLPMGSEPYLIDVTDKSTGEKFDVFFNRGITERSAWVIDPVKTEVMP